MPKKTKFNKFFNTYLNIDVPEDFDGEYRTDCFKTDCENPAEHLYVNCDDGTWNCKRCESTGNTKTLITYIHDKYLQETTPSQYAYLSELRGISTETLENAGLAYDYDEDRWLVPYYTYYPKEEKWSDFLNNLGYFYPSSANEKSRFVIKKATGLPLYLYNCGHVYPPSKDAIICEGEWDLWAYIDAHPDSQDILLAKPGSGFNARFLQTLEKTERVFLLLDNDDAGRKQTASSIRILEKEIAEIQILDWSLVPNPPKDIRDLWIRDGGDTPDILTEAYVPWEGTRPPEAEITGSYTTTLADYEEVDNFEQYTNTLKGAANLYITPDILTSMAAVFGITNSITIPGEPLWAFLIGPPGSGKTLFIDSFGGNNELFDNLSKISAKSLVSGWKDETGEEPSYLALLKDKSLFVKDFTVTLTDSPDSQREVFGLLTDIYDGYVKIPYGNNQVREFYNLYFNMIAGVTDIVHKHSAANIGERFLRIDWLGKEIDRKAFNRKALMNFGKKVEGKEILTKNTLGLVNRMRTMPMSLELQEEYLDPISELAEFISILRTKVDTDQKEGMNYRPRAELGGRLSLQLSKLFVGTRLVYDSDPHKDESTEIASRKSFEVVKRIGIDTCHGFPLDIVRTIAKHPGATRAEIAKEAHIHPTRAYRVLRDLCTTGVLANTNGKVGSRGGRPSGHYAIKPELLPVLQYEDSNKPKRKRKTHPSRLT